MKNYTIHFEALGKEANHLHEAVEKAKRDGFLSKDFTQIITPLTLQDYMTNNPSFLLPELITTKTHSIIPEEYLKGMKKSIISRSAGYDHFEHLSEKANITALQEYCVNAVAQTAVKFVFATTGYMNHYTENAAKFERNNTVSFTELGENRTATVFGVGKIGKKIYDYLTALGLRTQAVDIRQEQLSEEYGNDVNFVSKEVAMNTSDVIVNAMNLTKSSNSKFYNINYFSDDFFDKCTKNIYFINVTRGEIAPESTLIKYYKVGKILGIGVDVFSNENEFSNILNKKREPYTDNHKASLELLDYALTRNGNIYVQAHQGFNSDVAAKNKADETVKHIVSWYNNLGKYFDVQIPFYEK